MPNFIADDLDLGLRAKILLNNERRNCLYALLGVVEGCWCIDVMPDGGKVPCREATNLRVAGREGDPGDPLYAFDHYDAAGRPVYRRRAGSDRTATG
jgi:hypothetical protein